MRSDLNSIIFEGKVTYADNDGTFHIESTRVVDDAGNICKTSMQVRSTIKVSVGDLLRVVGRLEQGELGNRIYAEHVERKLRARENAE